MKSRYKFYLNDTLLETEPDGWDDITFFVKLDKELDGLLVFIDVELEFKNDGYNYLVDKLYTDGFCESVELVILEACDTDYTEIHRGIIRLSKLQVDERECSVKVKPEDNSFQAKIDKNRSLKVFPWVERSKNDTAITAATVDTIAFFTPATGILLSIDQSAGKEYTSTGYRVYELFRYLVAFMTDDTVDFDSTLFGIGGDYEGLMITSGTVLFTQQTGLSEAAFKDTFPEFSFEELYKEVKKKLNIGFYFDYSGLRPKMVIEYAQNIPSGVVTATLDNVGGITTKIDNTRLYNTLKIGSTTIADVPTPALQFPENIDWLGPKSETYNILGNCGVDTELDLESSYIISSNVIEDALLSPADTYEGQLVFISASPNPAHPQYFANATNTIDTAPPYYYNMDLFNSEVAKRFLGAVPAPIAKFLGTGDNTFLASRPTSGAQVYVANQTANCQQLVFIDDYTPPNFDNNNNWNIANSEYTCPLNGIYNFTTVVRVTVFPNNPPGFAMITNYVTFSRFDSGGIFINNYTTQIVQHTIDQNTTYTMTLSSAIFLNAGDKVKAYYCQRTDGYLNTPSSNPTSFSILAGSTITCDNDVSGGGIYQTYDPKDYLGLIHEFEYPITETQWASIKADPRGSIRFAQVDQNFRTARIDSLQYRKNGLSVVKLVRSVNT